MTVRLRRASENAVIYDGERIVVNNRQKIHFLLSTNHKRCSVFLKQKGIAGSSAQDFATALY